MTPRPALFLAANTPWVYALARCLAAQAPVTAVRLFDWPNYRRLQPHWPEATSPLRRVTRVLPQGYAGTLEPLFRPVMTALIAYEQARLRRAAGRAPIVVCPYPYLAPWVRHVARENLVYYNLDEYPYYDPPRTERILRLEGELVARAGLTVCLSVHQVATLRQRNPAHAARIQHFPLGVVEDFLNPHPEIPPIAHSVGYVGNLTDRVDWAFIGAVATRLPEATFHIVGRLDLPGVGTTDTTWLRQRKVALAHANVVYEGEVPQAQVREHYWRYAVNWMPYVTTHGFNIASCPTKIMDALASGRPFVSTDIPEVRLYPDRIGILRSPDDAAVTLRVLLQRQLAPYDAAGQIAYAATQTWPYRMQEFLRLLDVRNQRVYRS
jgi:teichuronic acid biosynthesis glycosyltransferase TuaH